MKNGTSLYKNTLSKMGRNYDSSGWAVIPAVIEKSVEYDLAKDEVKKTMKARNAEEEEKNAKKQPETVTEAPKKKIVRRRKEE